MLMGDVLIVSAVIGVAGGSGRAAESRGACCVVCGAAVRWMDNSRQVPDGGSRLHNHPAANPLELLILTLHW
jgi:hypothetical protein